MEPCGAGRSNVIQKEISSKYHSQRLQEAFIFLKYASFDPENASGSKTLNTDLISVREGMNTDLFLFLVFKNSMILYPGNPLYKDLKSFKFKDLLHLQPVCFHLKLNKITHL